MERLHKGIIGVIIASEISHIFCCVFPTLFSVLSLLAGFGFISTMPPFMTALHHVTHEWELPVIASSALLLLLGWGVTLWAQKYDCEQTCCHDDHGCAPRQQRSTLFLKIASGLFLVNVTIYLTLHHGLETLLHHH